MVCWKNAVTTVRLSKIDTNKNSQILWFTKHVTDMLCARTQRIKSSAISFKCPFYSVLFFVFFNINFAALASTHLIMIIYHTETHFALAQPWTNWFCLNVFSITLHCACAGAAIPPQWPEEELLLHVIYCVVQTRTYENKNKTHYYLSFCVSLDVRCGVSLMALCVRSKRLIWNESTAIWQILRSSVPVQCACVLTMWHVYASTASAVVWHTCCKSFSEGHRDIAMHATR